MLVSNEILTRTVACYRALHAHPELQPFMQDALRKSLETLASEIIVVLPPPRPPGSPPPPESPPEAALHATRGALGRVHHCIRSWYANHEEVLRQLGPLTLGDDPAQDVIRLTHLVAELPKIKAPLPVMVLPPDLVVAKLKTLIAEHHAATKTLGEASGEGKETQKKIIALRPRAFKLWQEEGLDAWIQVNVHTQSGQVAFGRERRHRARKAVDQTLEEKSGAGKKPGDTTLTGKSAPANDFGECGHRGSFEGQAQSCPGAGSS